MIDDNLIQQITTKIVERFNPRRVVLFGSRARGEASPDSDIDLFVELEGDLGKRPLDRAVEVRSIFGLHRWPMDVIVYTTDEVRALRGRTGTILSMIESEGRILYERT